MADGHSLEEEVEVEVLFYECCEIVDVVWRELVLLWRDESEMTLGDAEGFVTWQSAKNSDARRTGEGVLEIVEVAFAANLIEYHASDIQVRIKILEAMDQRGHAAGHG